MIKFSIFFFPSSIHSLLECFIFIFFIFSSDESDEASDGKSPVFEKKSETKSELESSEIDDDDDYDDDDFNESDDRESDWDSDEHQDWSRKRAKSNGFSQKKRKKKTQ